MGRSEGRRLDNTREFSGVVGVESGSLIFSLRWCERATTPQQAKHVRGRCLLIGPKILVAHAAIGREESCF